MIGAARSAAQKPQKQRRVALRVFVVDDVRASREIAAQILTEALGVSENQCHSICQRLSATKVDVAVFEDGASAWEAIQCCPPDVVLTDIEMPRMTGLDLLQRVRQTPDVSLSKTPFIIMTSLADGRLCDCVRQLDGNAVLQKPLEKSRLLTMMMTVIEQAERGLISEECFEQPCNTGPGLISPHFERLRSRLLNIGNGDQR